MLHLRTKDGLNVSCGIITEPTETMALLAVGNKQFYTKKELDGTTDTDSIFLVELIDVFDRIIIGNDTSLGSTEQAQLFNDYITQADTGFTDTLLQQLDAYLGGYMEELNETYFRVVCKQEYYNGNSVFCS